MKRKSDIVTCTLPVSVWLVQVATGPEIEVVGELVVLEVVLEDVEELDELVEEDDGVDELDELDGVDEVDVLELVVVPVVAGMST